MRPIKGDGHVLVRRRIISYVISFVALTFSFPVFAYDCSTSNPFQILNRQKITIEVHRLYWKKINGNPQQEAELICTKTGEIAAVDVQGREEEAYWCLKPLENEIHLCKTTLNEEDAQIAILPAIWIRHWDSSSVREFRFHAYVEAVKTPEKYLDILSRSLSYDLNPQPLILDGASRTGPANLSDGYSVRIKFN